MTDIIGSISIIKNFMGNAGRNICNEYLYDALKDAVDCMEKQISMRLETRQSEVSGEYYKCPICNQVVETRASYCRRCGQALEWP